MPIFQTIKGRLFLKMIVKKIQKLKDLKVLTDTLRAFFNLIKIIVKLASQI